MNEAENMVLVTVTYRIPGAHPVERNLHVLFNRQMIVQTDHFSARDHNFTGHGVGKFKNIVHQSHFRVVDKSALVAFLHNDADFFFRVCCSQLRGRR
ncbi:hypothetical protein D3C87_1888650 [compost metagenome]